LNLNLTAEQLCTVLTKDYKYRLARKIKDEGFEADFFVLETLTYAYTVHCTVKTYELYSVARSWPDSVAIFHGLSNKVYM
jgi:hypothetical protein